MRIVFFGTPIFAKTILEYLLSQECDVVAVVTRPDKPQGRSSKIVYSPVKTCALEKEIPLFQPEKASDPSFVTFLQTLHADFFVVAAYAEILKENLLQVPRLGSINVHGSVLPKYRGAAPVQRAIMAGDTQTGVTIMKMAAQLDAGDILAIRTTAIPPEMNAGELMDRLADLGKEALWEVLQAMEQGVAHPIAQDPNQASYAKKLSLQEAEVHWNMPAEVIHNHIRGVTPNPGAWCWVSFKGEPKRLLIKKALPLNEGGGQPGVILSSSKSELVVSCQTGSLQLIEIQLEGKKHMAVSEFLRGLSKESLSFSKEI